MNRGLIKNALVTIALTLILLTTYTLGTLATPSRAEKENSATETIPQEKPNTQNPQETAATPQEQVTNDSAVVQRLDRVVSILEDKLSSIDSSLSEMSKDLFKMKKKQAEILSFLEDKIFVRLHIIDGILFNISQAFGVDKGIYDTKIDEIIYLLRKIWNAAI